jgi:hypothetical protein
MYQGIKNHASLMRDTHSKGIVNVDNDSLIAYKRQRESNRVHKDELANLQRDLIDVRSEISEIKQMLAAVLHK